MTALSIFMFLTYGLDEVYKQTNIYWLDGPVCWNGEPPGSGVPEHDMAGPVLIVIDAQTARYDLQVLNPPVVRIAPHFGDELRRV